LAVGATIVGDRACFAFAIVAGATFPGLTIVAGATFLGFAVVARGAFLAVTVGARATLLTLAACAPAAFLALTVATRATRAGGLTRSISSGVAGRTATISTSNVRSTPANG